MKKFLFFIFALLFCGIGLSSRATVITDSVCNGSSRVIGGTIPNGYLYSWNTGATTPQITVSPLVNTVYTRTVLNATFGIILQDTFSILVKQKPNVWIAGQSLICSGSNDTLIASADMSSMMYAWNTGAINSQIIIAPATSMTYSVIGTNQFGCSDTASFAVLIQQFPVVYSTTGNSTYCANTTGSVLGLSGSESDCHYTLYNGNTPITTVNGTGSPISFGPQTIGTYTVKGYKNNLGCMSIMTGTITVSVAPLPGAISGVIGSDTLCEGITATYLASSSSNTTSYLWSAPNGATITSGQGTSSAIINWGNATGGNLLVSGVNSCGAGQAFTLPITIEAHPTLLVSASPASICSGGTSTLTATSNAIGYSWSTGSSSNSTSVTATNTSNFPLNTTYFVTVTGTNGCVDIGFIAVTVNPKPLASLNLAPSHACTDQNIVHLSGGYPSGGQYWSLNTPLWGDSLYPSISGQGTYTIYYTVSNQYGCSDTANGLFTVYPVPTLYFGQINGPIYTNTQPFVLITQPSGAVFTGPGVIPGAGGTYYFDPALAGVGMHVVTATYTHPISGCTAVEIQYVHVIPAITGIEETDRNQVSIYPNPAKDILYINGAEKFQYIEIYSIIGESVLKIKESNEVNITSLAPGTYIITLIDTNGNTIRKKFIKE
ncbi:MAG: T9SS type A sorting domain-containing protein [bacterium]